MPPPSGAAPALAEGSTERPPKAALMGARSFHMSSPGFVGEDDDDDPERGSAESAPSDALPSVEESERGARVAPADGDGGLASIEEASVSVSMSGNDPALARWPQDEEARRGFAPRCGRVARRADVGRLGPRAAPCSPGKKEGSGKFDTHARTAPIEKNGSGRGDLR